MTQTTGDRVMAIAPQSTTALVPHRVVVLETLNTQHYYDAFRTANRERLALRRELAARDGERDAYEFRCATWRAYNRIMGGRLRRMELVAVGGWGAALLCAALWVASLLGLG